MVGVALLDWNVKAMLMITKYEALSLQFECVFLFMEKCVLE